MAVVKVVEMIGTSNESFDDALDQLMKRSMSTIRKVTGIDVTGQRLVVEEGDVVEYRVNAKVAFKVEENKQ